MKDMGNWSELHLKEVTCYKILIFALLKDNYSFGYFFYANENYH